jgi:glycosyltransferase involved in cell wall biosynthesis
LRYIYEPTPGLLAGRHRGIRESQGEICAFIDDDVRLDPQWLLAIQDAFRDPAVSLASGPSSPLFEVVPPAWLEDFYEENDRGRFCVFLSLIDGGNEIKRVEASHIFGLNYVIRKRSALEYGGFYPECVPKSLQRFWGTGEDGLNESLRRRGAVALYHPSIRVHHEILAERLTIRYVEQRFFNKGLAESFGQIRTDGVPRPLSETGGEHVLGKLRSWWNLRRGSENTQARVRADQSYQAGYQFHQTAVRNDAKLLSWVLKPSYWDEYLPSGWQKFMFDHPKANISLRSKS